MLTAALLWSLGGIFIKLVPWNALAISGARGLLAAGVVAIFMRVRGMKFAVNKDTVKVAVTLALVCLSFVTANKLTTSANAIVIQYCAPVYVLLYIAFVLKKKLKPLDIVVVPVTILGVALCFIGQIGRGHLAGDLVAVASGVFFAAMFIVTEGVSEEARFNGIMQGQLLTALVGLPVLFATKPVFSAQAVIGILVLGILQIGVAYVFYAIAIQKAPLLTCTLLGVLEPLLNPLWVYLFAGENPGVWSLVGGVIVVTAITLWMIYDAKSSAKKPEPTHA